MGKSAKLGQMPNAPAFSAYRATSNQTVANTTFTKVQLNAEEFDTASAFDSTTNYRFTPQVPGYYQFNWLVYLSGGSGSYDCVASIWKNGSVAKAGLDSNSMQFALGGSAMVYLNGSTDYVELYIYQASGGNKDVTASQVQTFLQGFLVRPA